MNNIHPKPKCKCVSWDSLDRSMHTIFLGIYLRDHFLAVSSTPLWFHSSLRNTYIGIGGEDWSFDAVTFLLHCPLTSHHVTLQNSKVSVTSEVCSSNLTAHPQVHPPINLIHPSVQPYNRCHVQKKRKKHLTMTCRPSVTQLKWKIYCVWRWRWLLKWRLCGPVLSYSILGHKSIQIVVQHKIKGRIVWK